VDGRKEKFLAIDAIWRDCVKTDPRSKPLMPMSRPLCISRLVWPSDRVDENAAVKIYQSRIAFAQDFQVLLFLGFAHVARSVRLSYAESHLARLREGRPESIEPSSLHLDVLRDLKRIHSHICSAAYPVLEAAGELQPN
jgi:hypothetical protein